MEELNLEKLNKVSGGNPCKNGAYYIGPRCVGCGTCVGVCPCDAIVEDGSVFRIISERCNGCGACAQECPVGEIHGGGD